MTAVVLLLASAALVVAALTAWPTLTARRVAAHRPPAADAAPEPSPSEKIAPETEAPKAAAPTTAAAKERMPPRPAAAADPARSEPVAETASPPSGQAPESAVHSAAPPPVPEAAGGGAPADVDHAEQTRLATAAVDRSLKATLAALRRGDGPAARRAVDAADSAAGDEAALRSRVDRWVLLVKYAGDLETHRRRADESAAKGREYDIQGRVIGIVELTPETFAYKAAGRIERGPRHELPRAIQRAILAAWFAGDGRPANHIFLGIDRLLEPHADLAAVRQEWETALRGEPATAPLMPLLEDPLVVAAARQ